MTENQRFHKGDVIVVRDNEYKVTRVDKGPYGDIIQYRLEARREDMSGTLKPEQDGENVIVEYHGVDPEDITVIE